jgi:hypothetical protein
VVTLASSVLTTTDINGGTIDGAVIGGASAAAGSFTTLNTSGAVVFNDAGADVDFRVEGDTDANLLFVDASTDRVGIGTSSPGVKLAVSGTGTVSSRTIATDATGDASFFVQNDANNIAGPLIYGSTKAAYGALGSGEAAFYSNVACTLMSENLLKFAAGGNTEHMRIDTSGNVGIGTSSPSYKLDVNGASRAMTSVFSGGNINTAASANWFYIGNVQITSSESVEFVVYGTADYTVGEPRAARTTILLRGDTKVSGLGAVGYYWGESQGGTSLAGVALKSTSTNFYDVWILPGQFASCQVYARAAVFTSANSDTGSITQPAGSTALTSFWTLQTAGTERMRITSDGSFTMVKTDPTSLSAAGFAVDVRSGNLNSVTIVKNDSNFGTALWINRLAAVGDGTLVEFAESSTVEGSITVSGSTVSYLGGDLARWAQLLDGSKDESIKKGTVLSNLDEMNVYVKPTLYWTEDDELPVDEEGNPTVAVGDVKQETSVSDNEQLNKVKVSDVEGDANVAGVFVNWTYDEVHQVDEMVMAMTGDMIIRIAEGVTVARGDLLMSAGDGTAKPQGDDIVRSKTIAKVTSTHVTCTYEDGSYCVPCVLMAC